MPQLIGIALIGALGYVAWRALRREVNRVSATLRGAERDMAGADKVPTLEEDPETGIYRPREPGD